MKLLVVALSLVLASQAAFAAKKKHVIVVEDADSSSTATYTQHRTSSASQIIRTITPEIGMVVSDTSSSKTTSKTGFFIGGAVDLFKLGDFTFETGLQYKQQGAVYANNGVSAIFHMNYLVVPLAAKYFFMGERANGVYAKAGFMPGINVAHSQSDMDGNNSQSIDSANTFDLGLLLGAGGKLVIDHNLNLVMEVDYVKGLTDIVDASKAGESITNSSFTFLTGVAFNM